MPRITKQFPELKITEQLPNTIQDFLNKKNYYSFELIEQSLEFTPFFLFEFEAFSEKEKIVSESFSGKACLNASSKELDDSVIELFQGKLVNEIPEGITFNFLPEKLSKNTAEKLAPILLSKKLKIPKENIIVSEIKEFFLPIWRARIKLAEKEFSLKINPFTAEITSFPVIPERKKFWNELVKETFQELKQPSEWKKYVTASPTKSTETPHTKPETPHTKSETSLLNSIKYKLLNNELVQITILIIVLLIVIFLAF